MIYPPSAELHIAAAVSPAYGEVQQLDFFDGTNRLASLTNAPYRLAWPNAASGAHALKAVVTYKIGAVATSPEVPITIGSEGIGSGILPITYTWTGAHSSSWHDPNNWSPLGVPSICDTVIISPLAPTIVEGAIGSVRHVVLGGQCTLVYPSLEVTRSFLMLGGGIQGGVIQIPDTSQFTLGPLPIGGTNAYFSGTLINKGKLLIQGSFSWNCDGGEIDNFGTASWTGSISILGSEGTVFNNFGDFTAANDPAASFAGAPGLSTATFRNFGTFTNPPGTIETLFGNWAFENHGRLVMEGGSLTLARPGNGRHLFGGGSAVTGTGRIRIGDPSASVETRIEGVVVLAAGTTFELAAGGVLRGKGSFTGDGGFDWTGGTIMAELTFPPGQHWAISGPDDKILANDYIEPAGALYNLGVVDWTGEGAILGSDGVLFHNQGEFRARGGGVLASAPGSDTATFENPGSFIKLAGTGDTRITGWAFLQQGLVDVEGENLLLGYSGNLDHQWYSGSTFRRPGRTRVGDDTRPAPLKLAGEVLISPEAVVELSTGGLLKGQGSFIGAGLFVWSGGQIASDPTTATAVRLSALTRLDINGAATKVLESALLQSDGAAVWTDAGPIQLNGSQIVNNSTFEVRNDTNLDWNADCVFINRGTFVKSAGNGTTKIGEGVRFENAGWVDVRSGTLDAAAGLTQSAGRTTLNGDQLSTTGNHGLQLLQLTGGSLAGPGNLVATVENGGSVKPSLDVGILNLQGDYTQTAMGELKIQLNGRSPGLQFDQLNLSGQATLSGAISVSLGQGFVPQAGDSFQILTCGLRSGEFVVRNGLWLPNGLLLAPVYSTNGVALVATNAISIQTRLSITLLSRPGFGSELNWSSVTGQLYQVEYSPNLSNWYSLGAVTALSNRAWWIDLTNPVTVPARFYRLQ